MEQDTQSKNLSKRIFMEKISFCVTYYNQESFVEKSLSSIFSMDLPCDFEILVGDDGSSDNTISEVQKFIDKYPNKIKVFVQDRKETAKTINRASMNRLNIAKQATGDYILFLDGDDCYCDNHFIKNALSIFKNNPDIIGCGGNFKYIYPDNKEGIFQQSLKEGIIKAKKYIEKGNYTPSGAIIFKNILTDEKIKFLEKINNFDDNAITIYMLQFGDLYYIDTPLYAYYQAPDSLWNKCDNIEKELLNAMDYKLISTMAPKLKLEILKRQYGSLKALYKNKSKLKSLLDKSADKYTDLCRQNNDAFLLNLINWNNISPIQKIKIVFNWNLIKFSKKTNILIYKG